MAERAPSRLTEAILETAEGMHRTGIVGDATYEKIRVRHLGEKSKSAALPKRPKGPARNDKLAP
jgi:ribosomal protein S28E/S33